MREHPQAKWMKMEGVEEAIWGEPNRERSGGEDFSAFGL